MTIIIPQFYNFNVFFNKRLHDSPNCMLTFTGAIAGIYCYGNHPNCYGNHPNSDSCRSLFVLLLNQ